MMPSANPFTALARLIDAAANESRPAAADRFAAYDVWSAYYHGSIYQKASSGGQRENINAELGNGSAADLAGLYNPVAEVVDLYQHVLGGQFRPSDADEADDAPTDIRGECDTPATLAALDRVWQWSNINLVKQDLCHLTALHGTSGLRIVAEDHADPARRRVYVKPEHPRVIHDVELDTRGNVVAIIIEYDLTTGIGAAQQTITIREVMDKEQIATYRLDGSVTIPYDLATRQDNGPGAVYANALGFVPYVLVQHQRSGEAFGLNAFYRARIAIDRLNALLCHLDTQILDHVQVDWFIAAGGAAPTRIELNGRNIIYTDTSNGAAPPSAQPLVAPLRLGEAIAMCRLQLEQIENRLPELKASSGVYLSGQSGETVAQLRAPAEHRLGLARASYEDALVRAQQIALSWGILLECWDVGTGVGTLEAADTAYRSGLLDHRLNRRPLLPPVTTPSTPQPAQPVAAPQPATAARPGATTQADDATEDADAPTPPADATRR